MYLHTVLQWVGDSVGYLCYSVLKYTNDWGN